MKNKFSAKYFLLCMMLSLLGSKVEANRNYNDNYVSESRDCCASSCYECGCNPLYCGAWDLQVQGGVDPITWRNRGPISGVNCSLTPAVVSLYNSAPRFKSFFKIPWTVGGQVGYALSDNIRAYLEFDYVQAKAKHDVLINTDFIVPVPGGTAVPVTFNFNKYKLFEFYVGARYYWDRWCDRVAFFLGGKVGFTHHKQASTSLSFVSPVTSTPQVPSTQLFNRNNAVSGGANFGFDICFCGNWSLVITGEVVASCGPRNVNVLPISPAVFGFTQVLPGVIGTELRFPVTAAVRYSF